MQMSPLDFVLWMEGLMANRNALSATDIMSIKEKLKNVNKIDPGMPIQPIPYNPFPHIPSFPNPPYEVTCNIPQFSISKEE